MTGYTKIPDGLMTRLGLSLTEAFFFAKTFSFCQVENGTGVHYLTYEGMAKQFGVGRCTVIRAYDALCGRGLLEKVKRPGGTAFRLTSKGHLEYLKAQYQNETMESQNDTAESQNETAEYQNETAESQNETPNKNNQLIIQEEIIKQGSAPAPACTRKETDGLDDQSAVLEGIVQFYAARGQSYIPDWPTVTSSSMAIVRALRAIYGDEVLLSEVWPQWLEKAWRNSDGFQRKKFDLKYIAEHFNEYHNGKRNDRPDHLDYRPTTGGAESTITVDAHQQAVADNVFKELGMESP